MLDNLNLFLIAASILTVSFLIMPYFFYKGPKISIFLAFLRFLLVISCFASYFYFIYFEFLEYYKLCDAFIGCLSDVSILLLQALAVLIFLFGVFVFIYTIKVQKSTLLKPKNVLVTSGPYKFVRHPLYFSCIVCALGITIYIFSILGFLYLIVLCPVLINLYKNEEKELIKRFGDDYKEYKRKVPGIFPCKRFM